MGEKIEINPYVFTVTKVTSKKIEEINLILKRRIKIQLIFTLRIFLNS